jgi:hypothetical protein
MHPLPTPNAGFTLLGLGPAPELVRRPPRGGRERLSGWDSRHRPHLRKSNDADFGERYLAGTSEVNGDILRAEFNFLCKNNYIDRGLLNHEKWRPPKSIWWVLVASRLGSVDFAAQSRLTWLG